jgi:hypothetical protein
MQGYQTAHDKDEGQARQSWIDAATSNLETLRSGTSIGVIAHFADVWFGLFAHLDHEISPVQRLVHDSNEEIANAVQAGFVKLLDRGDDLPSPEEIAELRLDGRVRTISHAVLAGLDIMAERSQSEFLALPDDALTRS